MIKKFFIFSILFIEIISFFPGTISGAQETTQVLNMERKSRSNSSKISS